MYWTITVKFWLSLLVLVLPFRSAAQVSVFACEPEWKALAETVGGASLSVFSATTAKQDPHHIQARPSLIAKLRRADLHICTGADLEAGWLPLLIRRARNPKVLAGQPGHLMAAQHVELLEIPDRLDRSEGDVHADGNPHLHLNPENLLRVADVLTERLGRIDPDNGESYRSRLAKFEKRWTQAIGDWINDAHPLAGRAVIVHHKEWIYLLDWLGMERMAALEPKPGVPPAAGHLSQLKATLEQRPALAIIRSPINDKRPSEWLSARSGVPPLILPYTVGGTDDARDLFMLFAISISRATALTQ